MLRWIRNLDFSGLIALVFLLAVFGAVVFPFVTWVARGENVYPTVRTMARIEQELPAGYAALRVPIQPRIEYVRYSGTPPCLSFAVGRPTIPFQIDVVIVNGVAQQVIPSGTANPRLDPHVQNVCATWQGTLRFAFQFSGRFRVLIYPDLTWRLQWLAVESLPQGDATVCYAISRYPQWSGYVLPLCNVGPLTQVTVPAGVYNRIAIRCRNQLGLAADTRI